MLRLRKNLGQAGGQDNCSRKNRSESESKSRRLGGGGVEAAEFQVGVAEDGLVDVAVGADADQAVMGETQFARGGSVMQDLLAVEPGVSFAGVEAKLEGVVVFVETDGMGDLLLSPAVGESGDLAF